MDQNIEIGRFDYHDGAFDSHLFTMAIEYDSSGRVKAQYTSENRLFYQETIGSFEMGLDCDLRHKIKAISDRHLNEVGRTLRQRARTPTALLMDMGVYRAVGRRKIATQLSIPLKDVIEMGLFKELRSRSVAKISHFSQLLERQLMYDHNLHMIIEEKFAENAPSPAPDQEPRKMIDREWPLDGWFAKLLVIDPLTTKRHYPTFDEVIDNFLEVRFMRGECIDMTARDYQLYFEDRILFELKDGKSYKYDPALFDEICRLPDFLADVDQRFIGNFHSFKMSELYVQVHQALRSRSIDDKFIEKAIAKKYIPENCRRKLMSMRGQSFEEAIENSRLYGDEQAELAIRQAEIAPLSEVDKFLFDTVYWMCHGAGGSWSQGCHASAWNAVSKGYPYLLTEEALFTEQNSMHLLTRWEDSSNASYVKLKRFYKCLQDKEKLSQLNIIWPEHASMMLRLIKMFDLAISLLNTTRGRPKKPFKQSYALRSLVLEKNSSLLTIEGFTKTLFHENLKKEGFIRDASNWIALRVALHAKLHENALADVINLSARIKAGELSRIRVLGLTGLRGNTAAGKSTFGGKELGTLNTDPFKWRLRKGSRIKNHQVHAEGAMVFDRCFDAIENSDAYYIMDLRLISLVDVQKYLLLPAKKRGCPVFLSDFDVPLLTTLNRVLLRDPQGEDPIPSLGPMVDGFTRIRSQREMILKAVEEEATVEKYDLYYMGELVCQKENEKLEILNPQKYQLCLHNPSANEIEEDLNRTINEDYILEAAKRGDFTEHGELALRKWMGKTLRQALEEHAHS